MIRRLFQNKYGMLYLDSDMFGKRKRLSTGRKFDTRWEKYYEANFEKEYTILYNEKVGASPARSLTLLEYGKEVIEVTRKRRVERTHKRNLQILDELVDHFGDVDLTSITKMKCEQWQNVMLDTFAAKTVKNKRAVLHLVLDYAVDDGLIERNPLSRLSEPKRAKDADITELQKKRQPVYWPLSDVERLIESSSGQDRNVFELAAFSGLRGGEIIALRWENIDFDNDTIHVVEAISDKEVSTPKSGEARSITMFPRAKEALLRQQKNTGLSNYVFLTQYHKPYLQPDTITKRVDELCRTLNIEPGGLHDLRRFYNTLLKQLGYPSDFVLQQLGHKTEAVNRKHYTGKIRVNVSEFEDRMSALPD